MKEIRCSGVNIDGSQCKRTTEVEDDISVWYCYQHDQRKTDKTAEVGKRKLNQNEKDWILRWLADFNTPTEVVHLVKDKFNKNISSSTVSDYKSRYKEKINEIRIELNNNIAKEVDYANKYQRVKKLSQMIHMADRTGNLKNIRLCLKDIAEEMKEITDSQSDTNIDIYVNALNKIDDIWNED